MNALKLPLAAGSGIVVSLAVFALLSNMINRPVDAGSPVAATKINFSRIIETLPPETKRQPKAVRKPTPPTPGKPHVGPGDFGHEDTGFKWMPTAIPAPPKGRALPLGVDRDSLPLVRVSPDYPPRAEAQGIEGWVQVQFTITAAGTVRDAFVVAASHKNVFDDAALKAIARWRYNPRVQSGVAVERVGVQTMIRFELEKGTL